MVGSAGQAHPHRIIKGPIFAWQRRPRDLTVCLFEKGNGLANIFRS